MNFFHVDALGLAGPGMASWQDSRAVLAADPQNLTDDGRIGAESSAPQPIADDRDLLRSGCIDLRLSYCFAREKRAVPE